MLDEEDKGSIANIVEAIARVAPINLRYEDGNIRFTLMAFEDATRAACKALMGAGLQHISDDGKPEFYLSFADGAQRVDVRWPIDDTLPLWNE